LFKRAETCLALATTDSTNSSNRSVGRVSVAILTFFYKYKLEQLLALEPGGAVAGPAVSDVL